MAARFAFRLEPLLRLRRRTEEDAKVVLGRAVAQEEHQRALLADLEAGLNSSTEDQRRGRDGEVWVQGQMLSMDWNHRRHGEIAQQKERIKQAMAQVAEARALLVEARRGVQILEKLRERRLEQWKLGEKRREQATLSDIAALRWARQQTEP